ncbi:putative glucose-6-phosphate 1-dehydrogenase C7.13c [Trichinella spiralis]|uniref:Glucose-6-phosphate 1-dehydrogenase C7.13c n=1 Tax=Trichinella spiralis TaxID=6334 RepID=A0ABR3KE25_TRISP
MYVIKNKRIANGNLYIRYDIFPCLRLGFNNSKLQLSIIIFIQPNILLKLPSTVNRCSQFPHIHNKMSTKLETLSFVR